MAVIERGNPALKRWLTKDEARPGPDKAQPDRFSHLVSNLDGQTAHAPDA